MEGKHEDRRASHAWLRQGRVVAVAEKPQRGFSRWSCLALFAGAPLEFGFGSMSYTN